MLYKEKTVNKKNLNAGMDKHINLNKKKAKVLNNI